MDRGKETESKRASLSAGGESFRTWVKRVRARVWTSRDQRRLIQARANLARPRSVFFYTTHKCASTFVSGSLFKTILRNSEYEYVDYGTAIWNAGDKLDPGGEYEGFFAGAYSDIYSLHGKLYGPQRRFFDFPGRIGFRQIFFLRDPRDVLVSSFYSEAFTHPVPPSRAAQERLKRSRELACQQSLDDYVLLKAKEWVKPLFEQYKVARETAEDSLYLKYDSFVENTAGFVEELCRYLGAEPRQGEFQSLVRSAKPVQKKEVMKHKRSGKSGQYLEKLKPDTVNALNDMLADVLDYWEFR